MEGLRRAALRLIAIADEPGDDDDARLRKRVGVVAGYVTIFAPLATPAQVSFLPISWVLAIGLSLYCVGNLLILWWTHQFDRYVVALIASGLVYVPVVTVIGGGVTGSSAGLVWAFLIPAYAVMALGPRRATPWFVAFLLTLVIITIVDPWARDSFGGASYEARLLGTMMNAAMPLTILFVLLRWTDTRRRAAEARSEELLTNAIPSAIAARLKRGQEHIAEVYPETTVLFSDIAGFTAWVGQTDPDRVVSLLDDLFTRFDRVAADCGIEKIKTIGDAYMAVAGAPQAQSGHAEVALRAARDMLAAAAEWRQDAGVDLQVRIGLASGSVVGGVIGQRRILFDLWGDTVNTAARMQSSGVPGRIQLSAATRDRLQDTSRFEERTLDIKGLGVVSGYLVSP
jgi:adenylate cyclase